MIFHMRFCMHPCRVVARISQDRNAGQRTMRQIICLQKLWESAASLSCLLFVFLPFNDWHLEMQAEDSVQSHSIGPPSTKHPWDSYLQVVYPFSTR
jgi:hypothetical protein